MNINDFTIPMKGFSPTSLLNYMYSRNFFPQRSHLLLTVNPFLSLSHLLLTVNPFLSLSYLLLTLLVLLYILLLLRILSVRAGVQGPYDAYQGVVHYSSVPLIVTAIVLCQSMQS